MRHSPFPVLAALLAVVALGASACVSSGEPSGAASPACLSAASPSAGARASASPTAAPAPLGLLYRGEEAARAPFTDFEASLIASAKGLIGQKPNAKVTVNGRKFTLDCIGTVRAIFWGVGVDVALFFDRYPGNGVSRLYFTCKDLGVLHRDRLPRPGDVVIWDNTWDANDDGDRTNDPYTHAGMVMSVDEDGTINYIHESIFSGVLIEQMNLFHPGEAKDAKGKRINSGIAIATKTGGPKPEHWLAGDVFDSFGDIASVRDRLAMGGRGVLLAFGPRL
jgi:hypothetical protein